MTTEIVSQSTDMWAVLPCPTNDWCRGHEATEIDRCESDNWHSGPDIRLMDDEGPFDYRRAVTVARVVEDGAPSILLEIDLLWCCNPDELGNIAQEVTAALERARALATEWWAK